MKYLLQKQDLLLPLQLFCILTECQTVSILNMYQFFNCFFRLILYFDGMASLFDRFPSAGIIMRAKRG